MDERQVVSLVRKRRFKLGMMLYVVFLLAYIAPVEQYIPSFSAMAESGFAVEISLQEDTEQEAGEQEVSSTAVLQVEVIREDEEPSPWVGKRVLIYHTHTYEAYEQTEDAYEEIEQWRTSDSNHNVIAVGKALSASLTALGMVVEHDTTAFEPPTLDDAYDRSLTMLEKRRSAGETYDLYIDLHRDAIASTSTIKRTVNIGGEAVARFMVLIGKGTTGGYVEKPDWEANLVVAQSITDSLNDQCSGLARDVKIKTGRFNQHIADCCVLIECGMNSNTLDEVLAGIPYLAQAIASSFETTTE